MSRFELPILEPITKGIALALASVALSALGGAFFIGALPSPSPGLTENLTTLGIVLVPAYVVEVTWLVPRMGRGEEFEEWLGFVIGAGIAGLLAIAVSMLLSEHRLAGHANSLDDLGLSFVVFTLAILAGCLVLQPLLAHRFGDADLDGE